MRDGTEAVIAEMLADPGVEPQRRVGPLHVRRAAAAEGGDTRAALAGDRAETAPAFLAAVLLITIAPGPDSVYIVAVALGQGARAGVLSAVGMAVGMVVHVVAASLGLAVLLSSAVHPDRARSDSAAVPDARPHLPGRRPRWDSIVGLSAGRLGAVLAQGSRAATVLNVTAGSTFAVLALLLLGEALWAA